MGVIRIRLRFRVTPAFPQNVPTLYNLYVCSERINFVYYIYIVTSEHCAGSRTAEANEHTETAAFFSVDSGSEPESGISVNVSILINVLN